MRIDETAFLQWLLISYYSYKKTFILRNEFHLMTKVSKSLGQELLHIARQTVRSAFSNKNYRMKSEIRNRLSFTKGVFVNIYKKEDLRGSFGYPPGVYPLADGIKRAARGAAFKDPRFAGLTKREFNNTRFEVVLIGKLQLLRVKNPEDYFKKIDPKKHGIYIEQGPFKAMQLPVFASRLNLSSRDFLEKTIEKAGLAPEQWQSPNLKVHIFTTTRFSEFKSTENK